MTKPITLSTPRMRIVLGDPDDSSTWEQVEVQNLGRDMLAAESLFAKRKWGPAGDQPTRFGAVSCYYALLRTRQIDPATSWEQFESMYIDVEAMEDEKTGPTQPDPEAG